MVLLRSVWPSIEDFHVLVLSADIAVIVFYSYVPPLIQSAQIVRSEASQTHVLNWISEYFVYWEEFSENDELIGHERASSGSRPTIFDMKHVLNLIMDSFPYLFLKNII